MKNPFKAIADLFSKKKRPIVTEKILTPEESKELTTIIEKSIEQLNETKDAPLLTEAPQSVPEVPQEKIKELIKAKIDSDYREIVNELREEPIAPTLERQDEKSFDGIIPTILSKGIDSPYQIQEDEENKKLYEDFIFRPIEETKQKDEVVWEGDKATVVYHEGGQISSDTVLLETISSKEESKVTLENMTIKDFEKTVHQLDRQREQAKKQEFFNDRSHWPSAAKRF